MAVYTAGEIKKLYYVVESTYGTTPTSALTWGGEIISLKGNTDFKVEYHQLATSRSFGDTTRDATEAGFEVKALARATSGGYNWRNLWATYCYGSTSGLTEHLGSFTTQIGKTVGANNYYNFYNGCKINRLTLSAEAPAKPIVFDADIWARYVTPDTDKTIAGLQALTVGADPSDITTAILTWTGIQQINLGSAVNWYPKSWRLTVDNHLERQLGSVTGADANSYNLTYALNEGGRDIIYEATLWAENETYTNAKIAGTAVTSITVPVGAQTITLSNGVFEANDFPELKHALNEETVRIRFKSLSIA